MVREQSDSQALANFLDLPGAREQDLNNRKERRIRCQAREFRSADV